MQSKLRWQFQRASQTLFNVLNKTIDKLGNNDFNVNHTGVTMWQRLGTLEREVEYDEDNLEKSWEALTESQDQSSDNEEA